MQQRGFGVARVAQRLQVGRAHLPRLPAAAAGVEVRFVEDDLTALRHELGTFDVLVDYGTLDDLSAFRRDRYLDNVLPLAAPGARFLLWCFEWRPRRWDRSVGFVPMAPGEVEDRFRERLPSSALPGRPSLTRTSSFPETPHTS